MNLAERANWPTNKEPGWCEKEGVEHAWEFGGTIMMSPPRETRWCVNCGKAQSKRPAVWDDEDGIPSGMEINFTNHGD